MAIFIGIQGLGQYLHRRGPYLYFYDGKCKGINEEIVKHSNEISLQFKMLKVFQVDWLDKRGQYPFTPKEEMNTMYLYYDGLKVEEKHNPDKQTIEYLFLKAVEYFNLNLDRKIANIGSKPFLINKNEQPILRKKLIDQKLPERKRRWLLRKKIILSDDNSEDLVKINNEFYISKIIKSHNKPKSNLATLGIDDLNRNKVQKAKKKFLSTKTHFQSTDIKNKLIKKCLNNIQNNFKRNSAKDEGEFLSKIQISKNHPDIQTMKPQNICHEEKTSHISQKIRNKKNFLNREDETLISIPRKSQKNYTRKNKEINFNLPVYFAQNKNSESNSNIHHKDSIEIKIDKQ